MYKERTKITQGKRNQLHKIHTEKSSVAFATAASATNDVDNLHDCSGANRPRKIVESSRDQGTHFHKVPIAIGRQLENKVNIQSTRFIDRWCSIALYKRAKTFWSKLKTASEVNLHVPFGNF